MADLQNINIENYDMIVFFSPFGIQSLKSNFPNYQQGETTIAALGHQVLEAAENEGIKFNYGTYTRTSIHFYGNR